MMTLDEKFKALEADNAPGQEVWQDIDDLNTIMRGGKFDGVPVDFSHGDVDAFLPIHGTQGVLFSLTHLISWLPSLMFFCLH